MSYYLCVTRLSGAFRVRVWLHKTSQPQSRSVTLHAPMQKESNP